MALPPKLLPDDRRHYHAKPPVTALSHRPTGSYDLPACQVFENLDKTAALERKTEPDTANRCVMLEQMRKQFVKDSPVAAQRSKQTITAVMAESQGDHRLFMECMFQILVESLKIKTSVLVNSVDLPKEISEPRGTRSHTPLRDTYS